MSPRRSTDIASWRQLQRVFSSKEGNLKVIALCVITATTFWFFNALNKVDYTTQINYPIVFAYQSDSTYLLSQLPEDIAVRVNGGGWDLLRKTLSINVQPIEVDLEEPTKVKYITGESLSETVKALLGDVRLDRILTDTLHINIDSTLTKEVTVLLDSSAVSLEEAHWITSPVLVSPRRATLKGPASVVSQAPDTLMVQLPEQEINEDYEETVNISYNNPMAEVNPEEAEVRFSVDHFIAFSKSVPLILRHFPKDSSVYLAQKSVQVNFWVEEALAEDISVDSIRFRVIADLHRTGPDSLLIPVIRYRPDFAHQITMTPSQLNVRYAP